VADADGVDQSTMFISSFCAVRLVCQWVDSDGIVQKKILWDNKMANSPYSHAPIRMKYCPESKENVNCEGARLREQAKNLPPFLVPNTDVSIKCIGCPTLVGR